jgi:GNAT superfamily N-acetyltransferase
VSSAELVIAPVSGKADFDALIDVSYRINASDPNWVPPLRSETAELLTPGKNPFHEHAKMQLFLARRRGRPVGRISAHYDQLALAQPPEQGMGPGTGNWGLFEAEDEETAQALISAAEQWLREQGMTRVLAPITLSIWEEPGLLVKGHDHPPMVMMGHNRAEYEAWVEAAGYVKVKDLYTYDLDVTAPFPPIARRLVEMGEKNDRIRIRKVDRKRFEEEAALLLGILNDAWSDNWGYVPLTEREIAYAGKKLKPIVLEDMILVAEYDGEPVAFMMALPDINQFLRDLGGSLFPFGWAKLLWRLRRMRPSGGRVPLMGVVRRLHSTRLASQLAFMMIEYIRRAGTSHYGISRAEVGWVLEDNGPMISIAEAIESRINRVYRIYEKPL